MKTDLYGKKTSGKPAPERTYTWSPERRRYVRYVCAWKIKFCELDEKNTPEGIPTLHTGKCKDLSQGGIKISSFQPLKRNAFAMIEFDSALFSKHIQLESILKTAQNRLLAKVMWRHLNLETQIFEAGLEFLKESDRLKYKNLIDQVKAV